MQLMVLATIGRGAAKPCTPPNGFAGLCVSFVLVSADIKTTPFLAFPEGRNYPAVLF